MLNPYKLHSCVAVTRVVLYYNSLAAKFSQGNNSYYYLGLATCIKLAYKFIMHTLLL